MGCLMANPPVIDFSHNMRVLKLPKNTRIGTVIYRIKGTDADNDTIEFGVRGNIGNHLVWFQNVSFYEADVYLKNPLQDNEYKITLYASDGREVTEIESTILAIDTNNTQIESPFIPSDNIIKIPEDIKTNQTIATISVKQKQNSNIPATFELRGSNKFAIKYIFGPSGTSNAEIYLLETVDYEKQNLYVLTIVALNCWTNETFDTRNIAITEKVVVITDIPDSPPVFMGLPNVVKIGDNTKVGSIILNISADDGDYGNSRNISYEIDRRSPLVSYFGIDHIKGMIVLRRPIDDIKQEIGIKEPLILKVWAVEMVSPSDHTPALSTEAYIALVIVSTDNRRPVFKSDNLVGSIDENSQHMTPVTWTGMSVPQVSDPDPGLNGTIGLFIDDPSDTFMIQPQKGINDIIFSIVVKDTTKLDYESSVDKKFIIKITAKDQSPYLALNATIFCTIYLNDMNDNVPQFSQKVYEAHIPEDIGPGATVARIEATDADKSGDYGIVRYTAINGPLSDDLHLDSETGIIVLKTNENIDRELVSEYRVTIEARDDMGRGNRNVTELHIIITDKNDNAPVFLQPRYDAVLNPDRFTFTQPLIVRAMDADEWGTANSRISYEIIGGNYQNKFVINDTTGEIRLTSALVDDINPKVSASSSTSVNKFMPDFVLDVRAHDHGIPYQSSIVPVYVHNPDFLNRTVVFTIGDTVENVSKRKQYIESGMSALSGSKVHIYSIGPHRDREMTEVQAWMAYPSQSAVDLNKTPIILSDIMGKKYTAIDEKQSDRQQQGLATAQVAGNDYRLLLWLLIILILATLCFLIAFLLCWFCCCRDRIRRRQKLEEIDYNSPKNNTEVKSVKSSSTTTKPNNKDDKSYRKLSERQQRFRRSVQAWSDDSVDGQQQQRRQQQQPMRSVLRPSSAPNNDDDLNSYSRGVRANSSQSFPDGHYPRAAHHHQQQQHQSYQYQPQQQRVVYKMGRNNQRARVGPQYYDNSGYDPNNSDDISGVAAADYRSAYYYRSHNNTNNNSNNPYHHMTSFKGLPPVMTTNNNNMGQKYERTVGEANEQHYLIDDDLSEPVVNRRPAVHNQPSLPPFIAQQPKRTEILYIQSPAATVGPLPPPLPPPPPQSEDVLLRSISETDIPYDGQQQQQYLSDDIGDRHRAHLKAKQLQQQQLPPQQLLSQQQQQHQRHIYFPDHNVADMTIPEESVVPGMIPIGDLQQQQQQHHQQLIPVPTVTFAPQQQQASDVRPHPQQQQQQSFSSGRDNSIENPMKTQNSLKLQENINELVNYSPFDINNNNHNNNNEESIQITSISGVPVSIELKDNYNAINSNAAAADDKVSHNRTVNESSLIGSDEQQQQQQQQQQLRHHNNNKTKPMLAKDNSFDMQSDKSYDSDSGIGNRWPGMSSSSMMMNTNNNNNTTDMDMKNSKFIEKKSIFTIAYNDVKTRHLQSAESTAD